MKPLNLPSIGRRQQRGAALLVAMLLLALMLVLGVSSMESGIVQEKQSANMRDRTVAFENSEAAMRLGMDYLKNQILNGTSAPDNSPGYYYGGAVPVGGTINPSTDTATFDFWDGYTMDSVNSRKSTTMAPLKQTTDQGRFMIERMRFDDESEPASPTIYNIYFNVLTSRADGANGARVSQQSTLVTIPR